MKVVICGAGQVGYSIARYLAAEDVDITVIDRDPELVGKISDSLDVKGITGFASHPDRLEKAGAADSDMLIAVTHADEVNMVACQIAHSIFDIPTKIARIRDQSYLNPIWSDLFSRQNMPIDVIISPELEVAEAIERRLNVPGAFDVVPLVEDRIFLIGVHCTAETPIINTPLRQLTELFPSLHARVVALSREGRGFVPKADDELRVGDDIYAVVDQAHLQRTMEVLGHGEQEARKVVIVGGGNIGANLAQRIEDNHPRVQLKIIEVDKSRAATVARALARTVVIHGDALETDILEECNIENTEMIVAVSNDDEVNILSSLLAKRHGCQRATALINTTSYSSIISNLGIENAVNPRAITVSRILQHVRRGPIRSVHTIADGLGEIIEAEALEKSGLVGTPIRETKLPQGAIVAAVLRGENVILPCGDTVILPRDRVVVFCLTEAVKKVEKLFSVRVDFF